MAKELDLQSKIKASARKDGGYGQKMSNRFSIGIPDLLIGLPPFVPCYAEVKDFGTVAEQFNRQVDTTPKQRLEMARFSNPYQAAITPYTPNRHASLVLVGIIHRGRHRLVALSHGAERLDHTYEASTGTWVERGVGGYYALAGLLEAVGIARVALA